MNNHNTEMFADNFSSRLRKAPIGVAHLPGTGPPDMTCADCVHFELGRPRKGGTCGKAQAYWRAIRERVAKGQVPPTTAACSRFRALKSLQKKTKVQPQSGITNQLQNSCKEYTNASKSIVGKRSQSYSLDGPIGRICFRR